LIARGPDAFVAQVRDEIAALDRELA